MLEVECPKCKKIIEIEPEDLPRDCYDSEDLECVECGKVFKIGWYAEIEVR